MPSSPPPHSAPSSSHSSSSSSSLQVAYFTQTWQAQKKGLLLRKGESLMRGVEEVRQRMWAARGDLETFNELSKVRAALLTAVAANRAAMRGLRQEAARRAGAEREQGVEEEEEGEEEAEDAAAELVASLPAFMHDYEEGGDEEEEDDDYVVGDEEESDWDEVGSEISAAEAAEAATQYHGGVQ